MKLVCRQFRTFDEYGHKQTFVFENVNIYVSSVVKLYLQCSYLCR